MSEFNENPFRNDNSEGEDSQKSLSSYSDLFVAISFVFLFLFITANIQNEISQLVMEIQKEKDRKAQADEIRKINEKQQAEVQELISKYEKIIATYQSEKESYLKESAPKSEVEIYEQALGQLKLIEEEKFKKKEEYEKMSKSFEKKAKEYQDFRETLASIIDANLVIKKKIAKTQQAKDDLEQNLSSYKAAFKQKTIAEFNKDYEAKVSNMEKQLDKKFDEEVREVKKNYDVQIKKVQTTAKNEVKKVKSEAQNQLEKAKTEAQKKLQQAQQKAERKIASIQEAHQIQIQDELQKAKLSQEMLIAKNQEQYQAQLAKAQGEHKEEINSIKNQQAELAKQHAAALSDKEQEVKHFQDKLAFSKVNKQQAIEDIAQGIAKAFKEANLDATVDPKTGEVSLNFEEAYFKMGSHRLTKKMKAKLRQVLPIYANSVFNDKAKLDRIANFEIIGYSSPIFGSKYVNPKELSAKNYWALNYNLDLSYRRARSVFKYIFNPYKAKKFDKKQQMFHMTKVSGRSYLEGRVPSSMPKKKRLSWKKYCKKYDCEGQQKVVIKFNLKY